MQPPGSLCSSSAIRLATVRAAATRLGMADESFQPAPQLHADFWQLGGFTEPVSPATITTVVAHRLENLLFFWLTGRFSG